MTVSRLLKEASSRELAEWMAFFRLEEKERKANEKGRGSDVDQDILAWANKYAGV